MRKTLRVAGTIERARDAFGRRAWVEAYELLTEGARTGSLGPDDREHLAVAAYLAGRDDDSTRAWEQAHLDCLRAGDPDRAAQCAFWLAIILMLRGEMAPASGWLARAGRVLEESGLDCVGRGYLLVPAALQALHGGDAATADALSEAAEEIATRFGDHDLAAFARLGRGRAAVALGETARGAALLDEVMVAVTTGEVSPIPAGIVYCAVIETCMSAFDLRRAAEWTDALTRWCDGQPDLVPYRGQCLVHRSQILQIHGDWAEAAAAARRARERLSQPPHPALGVAVYQQAELHRLRGELAEADATYREASRCGRDPMPGLALLRLAEGRVDAAAGAIRTAVEQADPPGPTLLAAFVEIMVAAGDTAAARAAADELSTTAAGVDAPLVHAMTAHAVGAVLLAEGDARAALATLRQASQTWQSVEMPYEAARARVLVGLACRALGDLDTAERELDSARLAFTQLGAAPDLAKLEAATRPPASEAASPLSAREREVLRLVAGGSTNREIGAQLVISEHTVGRHLQNIFTKLGLSTRAAATAYAYEHGLV